MKYYTILMGLILTVSSAKANDYRAQEKYPGFLEAYQASCLTMGKNGKWGKKVVEDGVGKMSCDGWLTQIRKFYSENSAEKQKKYGELYPWLKDVLENN